MLSPGSCAPSAAGPATVTWGNRSGTYMGANFLVTSYTTGTRGHLSRTTQVSAEVTVLHGGRGNVYSENLEIMGCKQV